MSLPSLWYLPEILAIVRAYTNLSSFAALCQTSKSIYHLGHIFLYESIHLRLHKQHPESLTLLWRSIENNPTLPFHVKSLRLQFCDPSDPRTVVSKENRQVQREKLSLQSSVLYKIIDSCSNLRALSITYPFTLPKPIEQGIHKSLTILHQLQQLDLIIFDTDWPPHIPGELEDVNISLIPLAFGIDSLTTLSFTLQQSPESLLPTIALALPATSNITSLSIDRAYVSIEPLGNILGALSLLKHLHLSLHWHVDQVNSQVGEVFDCRNFGEALSQRSSTLETLQIAFRFKSWCAVEVGSGSAPWASWGLHHSIGDLRSFKRLSSLELAPEVLLGWMDVEIPPPLSELLPESLRHLNFRWDFGDWEYSPWEFEVLCGSVGEFLSSSPQPRLESLALMCYDDEPSDPELSAPFKSVKAKCEERQIKCSLTTV